MKFKPIAILAAIFTLNLFFRTYRNHFLQFWSDDEALHAAVVQRMLIIKKPVLVSPQPTLGTSIGSLFHLLSVPLFLISKSNLALVSTIFSLTGLATAFVFYLVGKEVKDKLTGLIASFLYSASFFTSLYDRRWWPITLTPLLSALAILFAVRLVKSRKTHYLPYLSAIFASAFHGDPAIIMIGLFALLVLLLFRLPLTKTHLVISAAIFFMAILPLIIFEIRHPETIIAPFLQTISRQKSIAVSGQKTIAQSAKISLDTVNFLFFPSPTQTAETLLYPQQTHFNKLIFVTFPLVLLLILFPLLKPNIPLKVIYVYIATFIIGSLIFSLVYHHPLQRVYLTLLFPAIFVLAAHTLSILNKLNKFVVLIFLTLFLLVNVSALNASRYRFPLSVRQQVVAAAIDQIGNNRFSLYAVGDPYLESGGFSRLFSLSNRPPTKSYDDAWLGWYFRTHGLYTATPSTEDQQYIVVISPSSKPLGLSKDIIWEKTFDSIRLTIIDNSTDWFTPDRLSGKRS